MKTINLLILATSMVALLSCSTSNAPLLDNDALVEEQTRSETSQTDSTKQGGVSATITPRETVTEDIVAGEIPYDNGVKNDSIPSDSIPVDSIPKDRISKDRIPKGSN